MLNFQHFLNFWLRRTTIPGPRKGRKGRERERRNWEKTHSNLSHSTNDFRAIRWPRHFKFADKLKEKREIDDIFKKSQLFHDVMCSFAFLTWAPENLKKLWAILNAKTQNKNYFKNFVGHVYLTFLRVFLPKRHVNFIHISAMSVTFWPKSIFASLRFQQTVRGRIFRLPPSDFRQKVRATFYR